MPLGMMPGGLQLGEKQWTRTERFQYLNICCAVVELLPLVCMDMNLTGSTLDSELAQEIWDSFPDVYIVRADKIGFRICVSSILAMCYDLFIRHRRLLIC